ncbi:MAG: rfbB [Nitrospira sp.]|nr:rfbB [Nitrospira sp.]
MRILVTGGAGFIGSHVVRRLIQGGRHSVVNLDALKYSGNLENLTDLAGHPHYTFVQGDICDQAVVQAILREHRIEGIINCAAETHVDRSILDPGAFARTDVVGTGILLEEARQAGIGRFLQVSTDEVYGSVEQGSSKEEDRLEPRSPYSASKAGGELLVMSYWTTYRFPVLVTRGSNTYGPNQYPEKFIPLFVTNAIDGEPLPLYGDGKNCRDWLSVYDHAAGIEHVFDHGEPGTIYNLGGGNERENVTVAEQIVTALGRSRSLIRSIDCSRLHALGWKPTVPFEEGLKQTVDWYRSHEHWWRKIKSGEFREYYQQQYANRLQKGQACGS